MINDESTMKKPKTKHRMENKKRQLDTMESPRYNGNYIETITKDASQPIRFNYWNRGTGFDLRITLRSTRPHPRVHLKQQQQLTLSQSRSYPQSSNKPSTTEAHWEKILKMYNDITNRIEMIVLKCFRDISRKSYDPYFFLATKPYI